jgi:O-antigen/teichoic acid export membrane protein
LSRVLQPSGTGQFAYTLSLTTYFITFATFGFTYYAQRGIANLAHDKPAQTKFFSEILVFRGVLVLFCFALDCILILSGVFAANATLMWISSIRIIAVALDISFLFFGNENFGVYVIRNVIFKSITLTLVFLLIKKPADVWIYALITALEIAIGHGLIWPYLVKQLKRFAGKLEIKKHIIPCLKLFIPAAAGAIYLAFNKTILGVLTNENAVGYYAQVEKIVLVCTSLIGVLNPVLLPRMVKAFANKNITLVHEQLAKALKLIFFLATPMMFGLIAVAQIAVPLILGAAYTPGIPILMILPISIFTIGTSGVIGIQYLVSSGRDNKFVMSTVIGAIVSLISTIVLTYFFSFTGTAIASVLGELFVTLSQMFFVRKEIKFVWIIKHSFKYLIIGAVMFVAVFSMTFVLNVNILSLAVLVLVGASIYLAGLIITRDGVLKEIAFSLISKLKSVFVSMKFKH